MRIASRPDQKGGVGEAWAEAEVEAEVEAEDNEDHQQLDQASYQRQGHQPQKSQNQHHDQPQPHQAVVDQGVQPVGDGLRGAQPSQVESTFG